MNKYTFRIYGDNAELLPVDYEGDTPVLFACTFLAANMQDAEALRETIFGLYNNPQRIGAPMSFSNIAIVP